MRFFGKTLFLLTGVALVSGLAWQALSYQPFDVAPELPGLAAAPGPGLERQGASRLAVSGQQPGPWMHFSTQAATTPALTHTTNILLAGIDTRSGPRGGRTDALVLVVLDRKSNHVGLVSIPRDLYIQIPGHGQDRINSVFAKGVRLKGTPAAGAALLSAAVRHTLGLPVAHVLFVDHAGFEALVDHLNGVTVQVACPIRDRFIDPRGPGQRLELALEAGAQHLDGRTALMFSRSRHGRGIFDRARRQQAVLLALRDRAVELGLRRVRGLLPALRKAVYTDLTTYQIMALTRRLARVKRAHIHGLLLGPRQARPVTVDGRWVMIPDAQAIHAALIQLFSAAAPGHRPARACPEMDVALRPRPPPQKAEASTELKLVRPAWAAGE